MRLCTAAIPLLLGTLAALSVPRAAAQLPSAPVIQVSLVGEQASIAPGQQFWVGVQFHLEKGWHIYWTNPGDSGEPPRVQWRLPAGFEAGELEWPHPERLVSKYTTDYGYADQVLLLAPLRAPADLAPGSHAGIGGTVKWVVCREVCMPGKTEVSLALRVEPQAAAETNAAFAAARRRIPVALPKAWRARARVEKDSFLLSLETGKRVAGAEFFPLVPGQIENVAPQTATPLARGVRLRLKQSEQLVKPVANLKGVLVLPTGQAYVIEAPVSGARNPRTSGTSGGKR